ncbi:MAG TPA: undecaprenyl-diphosphatase [Rhodocyclaceae bacterium]|nr:undecaprenyl-diphosphatase [Rhodocyclaceae bacterium]
MLAIFFAEWFIWIIPAMIGIGWLVGNEATRRMMLVAAVSGLSGLIVNSLIGLAWPHPRPFMIGLGHTLIPHVADPSFPSDHLTLWWAVAFSFLLQRGRRKTGSAMALSGIPIAWARIYLGVHFPFDMLGAVAVSIFSAWLALRTAGWYLEPTYQRAIRTQDLLFGRLITRGWIRNESGSGSIVYELHHEQHVQKPGERDWKLRS